jgi:hypothetical protein
MTTAAFAFAVPFCGRCVCPLPEPVAARFETGRRVVWSADREGGTLLHVSPESITVRWDESGIAVYNRCTLAARERVVVLETEGGGDWLA